MLVGATVSDRTFVVSYSETSPLLTVCQDMLFISCVCQSRFSPLWPYGNRSTQSRICLHILQDSMLNSMSLGDYSLADLCDLHLLLVSFFHFFPSSSSILPCWLGQHLAMMYSPCINIALSISATEYVQYKSTHDHIS